MPVGQPRNSIVELAGPERMGLDEFVRRGVEATGGFRKIVTDPGAICFGAKLDKQGLAPDANPQVGPTSYAEWLSRASK